MLVTQSEMLDNKREKIHPTTQKTLDLFVERLREHEKENLSQVILFGSVARGEVNKDSDIDVLVVLKKCSLKHREDTVQISASVMWDMNFDSNAYIQPITISEKDSEKRVNYSLLLNVEKDGLTLYDA